MTVFDRDYVYDIEDARGGYCCVSSNFANYFIIIPFEPYIAPYYQEPHLLEPLWIGECLHAQLFVSE